MFKQTQALALSLLAFALPSAQAEITEVEVAAGKNLQAIYCLMPNSTPIDLRDRVKDVIIKRVSTAGAIKYEIYTHHTRELIAACDGFALK